jgi:arylsulfatase A-like enzyme
MVRVLALVELLVAGGQAPEPPVRPSILIVLVDSLRPDYLGIYGFDGEISPAIDRLAMESIVFENSFTTAPWTKPVSLPC